jgi:hypothetical protein
MKVGKYVVTSKTGDSKWHETSANTLHGAKLYASRRYQASVGGSIEVGMATNEFSVRTVSIKYGFDKWADL